jgi:ABC-type Na+ efflux pump permease subunit
MEGRFIVKSLQQILAIARTEFRFSFRRSAPAVVTVLIGLLVSAGILVSQIAMLPNWSTAENMTPDQLERWTSNGFTLEEHLPFLREALGDSLVGTSMLAWLTMLIALLFLPAATVSAIPADRKFGVLELLRCTPITGSRYLAGKVLGVLSAILLVSAIMLALFFMVSEIILFSSLHFGLSWSASLYLIKLSLLDGIPILAWGTVTGILFGVLFRSRRAAIFPGLITGLLSIFFWLSIFRAPSTELGLPVVDKIEQYLLQNYNSPAIEIEARVIGDKVNLFGITTQVGFGEIILMYIAILVALLGLAILARLWLQWKENF